MDFFQIFYCGLNQPAAKHCTDVTHPTPPQWDGGIGKKNESLWDEIKTFF